MPRTPQVYCPFCKTIGTLDSLQGRIKAEAQYRLCDTCGTYSKPRKFGWGVDSVWDDDKVDGCKIHPG
jgi:hypothetical protein